MHRHTRRLVDDDHVLVFVEDAEGHCFRQRLRGHWDWHPHRKMLATLEPRAGLDKRPAIQIDESFCDQTVGLRARHMA